MIYWSCMLRTGAGAVWRSIEHRNSYTYKESGCYQESQTLYLLYFSKFLLICQLEGSWFNTYFELFFRYLKTLSENSSENRFTVFWGQKIKKTNFKVFKAIFWSTNFHEVIILMWVAVRKSFTLKIILKDFIPILFRK